MLTELRPHLLLKTGQADAALTWWTQRPKIRPRDPQGRMLALDPAVHRADCEAEVLLKSLKTKDSVRGAQPIDQVMADAAVLVKVRHGLRQIVNAKDG